MMGNGTDQRADFIDVYRRVTHIIWQRMSPTFGSRTINAIARNVIQRRAAQRPAVASLRVGEEGLVWEGLEKRLGEIPIEELRASLDELLDDFFEALATLIGRLVVGKIFKDAEAAAKKEETP